MKINTLKPLSIAVCCFALALYSTAQSMEARSSAQREIDELGGKISQQSLTVIRLESELSIITTEYNSIKSWHVFKSKKQTEQAMLAAQDKRFEAVCMFDSYKSKWHELTGSEWGK